jgi:hypothetical protein
MCASIHGTYLFAFLAPSTAPWNSLRWTSVIARRAKFDTLLYKSLAASYIPSSKHRSPIWKIKQENYQLLLHMDPTTPQIRFESDIKTGQPHSFHLLPLWTPSSDRDVLYPHTVQTFPLVYTGFHLLPTSCRPSL